MSTVVLDTITGKSTATTITIGSTPVVSASANSMTIRGEGSNQTSIQQGLNKTWINLNGTGTIATRDSFNVTSITDNSTGDYTITIATDMASGNYTVATNAGDKQLSSLGHVGINGESAPAAGSIRLGTTATDGSNFDHTYVMIQIAGDLS